MAQNVNVAMSTAQQKWGRWADAVYLDLGSQTQKRQWGQLGQSLRPMLIFFGILKIKTFWDL